jgi:hypothetical protein
MVEILRRHAAILAIAILAWLGYGDLNPDSGKKKAEAKTVKLEILPSALRVRGPDETLPPIVDPYRLKEDAERDAAAIAAAAAARPSARKSAAARSGSTPDASGPRAPAAPADPADMAIAWLATVRTLGRDLLAAVRGLDHPPAPAAGAAPAPGAASPQGATAPPPPKPVSFVLHLESTLATPDGGQARISGQTVQVGASLQGLDPEKPPRLLSVRGTEAVVAHGDDVYVLDLASRPVVTVGNPALAAAEATPVQAGGASSTERPRGTRGPTSAGPAAPKAPAAAKPASGTKGGYKVRKLPTKKKP